MKKLFSYLDKIGVNYRPVEYGYNYFQNVQPFTCSAALVSFEFCDYATVNKWHIQEKKIRRYAERYGYIIINEGGCLGECWFTVMRKADNDILSDYSVFERNSIFECETLAHKYYTGAVSGIVLNDECRKIMDYYGSLYNDFLKACEEVTA